MANPLPGTMLGNAAKQVSLALAYYVAGSLTLLLAIPPGFATPVWPAAGIALAGVLVWGNGVLPAVFLGSFFTNLLIATKAGADIAALIPVMIAAGIAGGAVLQALFGAWLVRRVLLLPTEFANLGELMSLLLRGGVVSCMVNSVIGPLVLLLAGLIPASAYLISVYTWWVGDLIGVVLFAPMLLLLANAAVPRSRKLLVALPTLIFAAIAIMVFFDVKQQQINDKQLELDGFASDIAAEFEKEFEIYINVLTAGERFINASNEVTAKEFRVFTRAFLERYPSIASLSWNPAVEHSERGAHERQIRAQGYPNYFIKDRLEAGGIVPAAERDRYFPVAYLEPYAANELAHGYDTYDPHLVSGNARRKTLDRARDEGRAISTGRISLVQADQQYGLLIYHPVYSNKLSSNKVVDRRASLIGYTAGAFIVPKLVEDIARQAARIGLSLMLRDLSGAPESQVIFDARTPDKKQLQDQVAGGDSSFGRAAEFTAVGRQWEVRLGHIQDAAVGGQGWYLWYLLTGGLLLCASFGAFVILLSANAASIRRQIDAERSSAAVQDGGLQSPRSIAIGVAIVVLIGAIGVWQQLRGQEIKQAHRTVQSHAQLITREISRQADDLTRALQRMARRWENASGTAQELWYSDAEEYISAYPLLRSLAWVDSEFRPRWIGPSSGGENAATKNALYNVKWQAVMEQAAKSQQPALTEPLDLEMGYRTLGLLVPMHIDNQFHGFIVALLDVSDLLRLTLSSEQTAAYDIYIGDGPDLIQRSSPNAFANHALQAERSLQILNRDWLVKLAPKDNFLTQQQQWTVEVILLAGVVLSIMAGMLVYTTAISNERSSMLAARQIQLQQSEARINLVLDNAGEGIYGLDLAGRTTFANKAATRILGYELSEMLNVLQHDLIHHTRADGTPFPIEECSVYAALVDGEIHTEDGEVFWHKNGQPIEVEYTSAPARDEAGRITGAVVVFRDIAERKRAEKELLHANAELEEFAYRTSHDLRSPLVSSIGLISVAQKAISNQNQDIAVQSLNHVSESLLKLEVLVKDILSLTKTKISEEKTEPIRMDAVVDQTLEKLSHMDGFSRITFERDFSSIGEVWLKKGRFFSIVENLISNAIKYQNPAESQPHVKISAWLNGRDLHFCVADNGLGIPIESQPHLFTMFKRFHANVSFGSGLGLYMMKKSADHLGGRIEFEDIELGAKFTLVVPVAEEA